MRKKNLDKRVLVIAAHPDDEILGCGGTLAKFIKEGCYVSVIILSDGILSRIDESSLLDREKISHRQQCAINANNVLGVQDLQFCLFPDNQMDTVPLLEVVKAIEKEIDRVKPEIVLTHHYGDVNVDHSIVHEAVLAACRPQPGHSAHTLMFFEIPSSTEWRPASSPESFKPNWFVDISKTLDFKLKAMKEYENEVRNFPHPRSLESIEHLAGWRGASVGVFAAEAFELGRRIE